MARKKKEPPVRFFTADGVEVETVLDLAGPHKDELVKRIVAALARDAARRIFSPTPGRNLHALVSSRVPKTSLQQAKDH